MRSIYLMKMELFTVGPFQSIMDTVLIREIKWHILPPCFRIKI